MALKLLATLLILLLHPNTPESNWIRHPLPVNLPPLCSSQFALVNRECSRLPYTPVPPPAPPSPPSQDDGEESRHRHHHGHHHNHRNRKHVYKETPAEAECCRWLKEVDNVCVCDLLAHLPPFLTRPVHNYTVVVDDSCNVSFQCGSGLVQF